MNARLPRLTPEMLAERLAASAFRENVSDLDRVAFLQAAEDATRRATREAEAVHVLSDLATPEEIKDARRRCAVRRGKEVFLPSWKDFHTGMPNLLLRSSLWSARLIPHSTSAKAGASNSSDEPEVHPEATAIASYDNATLINRGPALGSYDRRVFAACLDYYREDSALTPSAEEARYIQVSYFKFIATLGSAYSIEGRRALRASLERLSAMSLHLRHKGLELHLPRILDVSFLDAESRHEEKLKSSDLICFRVREDFAEMYGSYMWTAVPHDALNAGDGLKSWLACFYATHSKPFPLQLNQLQKLAGSVAPMWKFKAQLKKALDDMKAPGFPKDARVAGYELSDRSVTVRMARWTQKLATQAAE